MRSFSVGLLLAFLSYAVYNHASKDVCSPSTKLDLASGNCIQLTNEDILRSLNWLASPPKVPKSQKCSKVNTIQGIDLCEDFLPSDMKKCIMWSVITSVGCNHYGSLEFEKYWAGRGCQITLYTYSALKTQAAGECEYETESKRRNLH